MIFRLKLVGAATTASTVCPAAARTSRDAAVLWRTPRGAVTSRFTRAEVK